MKWLTGILKWITILFFSSTILAVVAYRFIPVYVTPLMISRALGQAMDGERVVWHHSWQPLDQISKHLPVAVMASEDQLFLLHHGFDTKAIGDAIQYNKTHAHRRGASTITQQTAKNVFLWPKANFVRKGIEAYFTVLIELFWSKQRIMEVYLNSIEMGKGIYGADAVAHINFNTTPDRLTKDQCAYIAVSLPNPLHRDSAHPSAKMKKMHNTIKKRMNQIDQFPKELCAQ
jgi:monofunctional biosynthetic peptidoglycan transglycosylase